MRETIFTSKQQLFIDIYVAQVKQSIPMYNKSLAWLYWDWMHPVVARIHDGHSVSAIMQQAIASAQQDMSEILEALTRDAIRFYVVDGKFKYAMDIERIDGSHVYVNGKYAQHVLHVQQFADKEVADAIQAWMDGQQGLDGKTIKLS